MELRLSCAKVFLPINAIIISGFFNILFSFYQQYSEIWALDEKDPFMRPEGGESVYDIVARLTRAFATIEAQFQG